MNQLREYSNYRHRYDSRSSQRAIMQKEKSRIKASRRLLLLSVSVVPILLMIIVFVLISNGESDLIGVWQYNEYTKYEFCEDGKGRLFADDVCYEYTYKISDGQLEMDFIEDIVRDCAYEYSVDEIKLKLIGGQGTDGGIYELYRIS